MRAVALLAVVACSKPASEPAPVPLEQPSTACYTGRIVGSDVPLRTIVRRTLDPATKQIRVDRTREDHEGRVQTSRTLARVDGNRYTVEETKGAFRGSGTLTGAPWKWTAWTSTSELLGEDLQGTRIVSSEELTSTGLKIVDTYTLCLLYTSPSPRD